MSRWDHDLKNEPGKQTVKTEAEIRDFFSNETPGWFERLGIGYFHQLAEKERRSANPHTQARTDDEMVRQVKKITLVAFIIVFVIGGISAGGSVATERLFPDNACAHIISGSCLEKYAWVAAVTILLTAVEFAVLFWAAIRAVFYISRVTGHSRLESENDLFAVQVPNLLARAALEIPDPVREVFGIDPLKRVSKKKLLLVGILYKVKVAFSNVLAKQIMKRVFGKSVVRVGTDFIAVPVTGLWNSIVIFKVAREARLRLFGNLLARHLVSQEFTPEKLSRLSPRARLACLQAVGNSIVLTQNYHPNMLILLVRLSSLFDYDGGEILDEWEVFLANLKSLTERERYFIMDLLAVSAAFDGRVSNLEKKTLGEAFQEHTEIYFQRIYRLKNLLLEGRFYESVRECALDFEAG